MLLKLSADFDEMELWTSEINRTGQIITLKESTRIFQWGLIFIMFAVYKPSVAEASRFQNADKNLVCFNRIVQFGDNVFKFMQIMWM